MHLVVENLRRGKRTLQHFKKCEGVIPWHFFLFICRFPSVEDGPGGIYLSGQSSYPASRCYLRIDPTARVG